MRRDERNEEIKEKRESNGIGAQEERKKKGRREENETEKER